MVGAFDLAWRVLKAPINEKLKRDDKFTMLRYLERSSPFSHSIWQSKDGNSRGTYYPDDFHNSIKINNFELNSDVKGHGKAREHLENFISEAKDHAMEQGYDYLPGTHVTNVEHHAAGFWNKMVDANVIDGAHSTGHIRTNNFGDEHYTHAHSGTDSEVRTQPWQHALNPEYAEYHDLPTEAYLEEYSQ